jgi:hypothetical protein
MARYLADWMAEAPFLIASALVVAFLVGIAALLGFRQAARLDEAAVARLAAGEGATLEAAAIAEDGKAALARLGDGRLMVARVMGGDVSARLFQPAQARLSLTSGRLTAVFGDVGYPALNMRIKEAPAWLAALAGEGNT